MTAAASRLFRRESRSLESGCRALSGQGGRVEGRNRHRLSILGSAWGVAPGFPLCPRNTVTVSTAQYLTLPYLEILPLLPLGGVRVAIE